MVTLSNPGREHRVDFLRGIALATIFINHIPGNVLSHFTPVNFGFSDAAEIFVTLAGFAAAQAYFPTYAKGDRLAATLKSWRRAWLLYLCHIASTIACVAILAAAAILFARPGYLADTIEPLYVNVAPLFTDPPRGYIGLATLGHQLGYFNILPMYMVLLFAMPAIMALALHGLVPLVTASVALWIAAGTFAVDFPNYPTPGGWYFNPFAWQILLVGGFALGVAWRQRLNVKLPRWLVVIAVGYVILAGIVRVNQLWAYFPALPLPPLIWGFEKGYVALPRLLHGLALLVILLGTPLWSLLSRIPTSSPFHAMGRNALAVFCWGEILCLVATIARFELGGGIAVDLALVVAHFAVIASFATILDRLRSLKAAKPGDAIAGKMDGSPAPQLDAMSQSAL
ncbi:MAG TPA: OpgC domain-containing protein [Aestuariivirgaceae bacterium]|jgi:hypothetical protein|nr:OpgC domain-containing protein [Aestuariivirgaceae bacterium]